MMRLTTLLLAFTVFTTNYSLRACDGFNPQVISNEYIGNGEYLITLEICEWVSNSETLNGVIVDQASVHGFLITVNGANIISFQPPSLTGATSGVTINGVQVAPNQIEYGDWGNSAAPIFLDYGDPQECFTIQIVVDADATSVDVLGSSSESAVQPGFGMSDYGGTWGCGEGLASPPPVCDASWTPPILCTGTAPIDLDNTTLGTGVFSGPGVNSGNGMFDPSGLSGSVSVDFTVGDAFFNCTQTGIIQIIDMTPPNLTDTTVCVGNPAPLDATIDPAAAPPPPPTPCDYSISLEDTYGDGWNGGSVTVLVNGNPVLTSVTLGSGYGPANYNFTVMPGDVITVNYSGGSWTSENYYTIYDAQNGGGSSIGGSTQGATPPASQNITNPCGGGGAGNGGNCTYTLVLDDSYGDGWNGADIDIYVNGVLYQGNVTVASCGGFGNVPCQNTISIPVNDGDLITLFYTAGSFNSENTIYMYDNDMNLVNSLNNPPNGWLGGGVTASCPQPTFNYTWSNGATLSDPNIADPVSNTGSTTTYTVTINSPELGCTSTFSATVTIDPCGLPVEMAYFDGECQNDDVLLSWMTVSELNCKEFIVEHSHNGVDFSPIGSVAGHGTTNEEYYYSYRHANNDDHTAYYRLKQVDLDGSEYVYDQIATNCFENNVRAYLNGKSQVVIINKEDNDYVRIMDGSGRIITEGTQSVYNVDKISSNILIIEITTETGIEHTRLFVH